MRGYIEKKKSSCLRGAATDYPPLLLTMTLVVLWCVVSGVSWKSSGEMLAAGVEDVNAVSGLIPGFQELPGGQPQMARLVENSFLCCSKSVLESQCS